MNGIEKVLVDKEKVIIDGKEAYRLYFFDAQEGYIIRVISFVATNDIMLNQPKGTPIETSTTVSQVEVFKNAL